jgi:uncharacterized protein
VKKILISIPIVYCLILAGLYYFQDQIIFHEKELNFDYKFDFQEPFQEIYIPVYAKELLNTLHFFPKSQKRKGIVVYFHGNADNLVRWGNYAKDFTKNGYEVLMIDYRGFGKSAKLDYFSEKDFIEDGQFAYNYAKTLYPENKIIVYGRSLGSGIATNIASKNHPKLLLLETPYVNLTDAAEHFLPIFPYKKISRYHFPTDEIIGKVKCPIHLFHGTHDGLVYYESSLKLCKILNKNPVEIVTTIEGGKHKNLSDFPKYHQALDSVLAIN